MASTVRLSLLLGKFKAVSEIGDGFNNTQGNKVSQQG
jgi:hypothetical protein